MSLTPAGKPGTTADSFERLLAPPGRRRTAAGVAVALIGPVLATVLASIPSHRGTAVPALLYLLAVVAAAAIGHLWPALLAAALSFVGLDYYFTEPTHTFVVSKGEDLFALAVFMVVAAAVSAARAVVTACACAVRSAVIKARAALCGSVRSGMPRPGP